MIKTNFHTHHYLCSHAIGETEDYVLEAIKNNYQQIGISDHGPLPIEPPFYRMSHYEFENIYLKDIERNIKKYQDQIEIYKGLEIEYIYNYDEFYLKLLEKVDYLLLGLHYYSGDEKKINSKSSYDVYNHESLEEYTRLAIDAMNTGFFKIFAHPDIFMISYPIFDSFAEDCVLRIAEAAIHNNVVLEFNVAGIRKGINSYPFRENDYWYPNRNFWNTISKTDAKVIIGSDCHSPELLEDEYVKFARELAKKYNLNIIETIY